jgi:hypothetical protein
MVLAHFLTIQSVFSFYFKIFQIGKNFHGANPWENGRQTFLQFFGIFQIQIV